MDSWLSVCYHFAFHHRSWKLIRKQPDNRVNPGLRWNTNYCFIWHSNQTTVCGRLGKLFIEFHQTAPFPNPKWQRCLPAHLNDKLGLDELSTKHPLTSNWHTWWRAWSFASEWNEEKSGSVQRSAQFQYGEREALGLAFNARFNSRKAALSSGVSRSLKAIDDSVNSAVIYDGLT